MKSFCYTVQDALGIHARPAGMLVKYAGTFHSQIRLMKSEKVGDAKKIFSVMGMAVKCGDMVVIECDGEDEDTACQALETFFKENL